MANEIKVVDGKGSRKEFMFNDIFLGYAYPEVDGFYVFVFEGIGGSWSDYSLKWIAERLTELNKGWQEVIDNDPAVSKSAADRDKLARRVIAYARMNKSAGFNGYDREPEKGSIYEISLAILGMKHNEMVADKCDMPDEKSVKEFEEKNKCTCNYTYEESLHDTLQQHTPCPIHGRFSDQKPNNGSTSTV